MKYVGQIIFSGEADDLAAAKAQADEFAEAIPGATVAHVSDSLGGQFNPVHLLDAQSAFGHIAPEAPAEDLEIGAEDVGELPDVSGDE